MLKKTLESPLDGEEIQPVHPKGNQCWIFIGRTDAEAETPILWPPDVKNKLVGKDTDGKTLSYWKRLKARGEGYDRGWDGWMASVMPWTCFSVGSASWWSIRKEAWHAAVHGVTKSWTRLRDWSELKIVIYGLWLRTQFHSHHIYKIFLNVLRHFFFFSYQVNSKISQ